MPVIFSFFGECKSLQPSYQFQPLSKVFYIKVLCQSLKRQHQVHYPNHLISSLPNFPITCTTTITIIDIICKYCTIIYCPQLGTTTLLSPNLPTCTTTTSIIDTIICKYYPIISFLQCGTTDALSIFYCHLIYQYVLLP